MLGHGHFVELGASARTVIAMETPMVPPRLRATLMRADAWLVFSGGKSAYEAVVIGTRRNGMPTI